MTAACTCGKGDEAPAIVHADDCPCIDWIAGSLEGESAAHTESRELTEYEKGYLDGLLHGSRHAEPRRSHHKVYKEDAERYLRSIGLGDWSVNVKRV